MPALTQGTPSATKGASSGGARPGSEYSLERLLAGVDHPVHRQVVGALEGSSTIFTDVISLVCMMFGMSEKLLLEPEESSTGGMGTYIFLLQQMLVFNVMLQIARVSKDSPEAFHLTADVLDGGLLSPFG